MPISMIMIDDFLQDPQAFRADALRLTYPDQKGAFPGRNSQERLEISGLDLEVSRLLGEPLQAIRKLSHGKCRITLAKDESYARVHTDPSYWSGILYLSKPEDCRGGTQFFRHIRTQSDRAPISVSELAAMGYKSQDEAYEDIIAKDTLNEDAWELTMELPMRFNRLVLLRPWYWHTAGAGFGDSLENGRLVYLMFFEPARRP